MEAAEYASQLRHRLGFETAPYSPFDALEHLQVKVERPSLEGCDGATVRVDADHAVVLISDLITEQGRVNFTAAHELGHIVIPHHSEIERFDCTHESIGLGGAEQAVHEREANEFAAEWLMPARLLGPACATGFPSFQLSAQIAEKCGSTIMASTLRFIELTKTPVMLIVSQDGYWRWYRKGSAFKYFVARPEEGRVPFALDATFDEPPDKSHFVSVPTTKWIDEGLPAPERLLECSMRLGAYDTVLTLLVPEDASSSDGGQDS